MHALAYGGVESDTIQIIKLSGSSYEIGLEHGRLLNNEIHQLIELWEQDLESAYGMPADTFIAAFIKNTDYIQAIKRWTPGLLEEIKGIGDGAGIDFEKIFVFQLVDEIWTNGSIVKSPHHCTSVGVIGDNVNYIAQNLDIPTFYHEYKLLLEISDKLSGEITYVTTFPGFIGANGMNRHVGVCVNSLMDLEYSSDGLPVCCVVRGVLGKRSFSEAEAFLREVKHASGQNYIVGTKDSIASLECSAVKVAAYWPDSSKQYTYHANNSLANDSYRPKYLKYVEEVLQASPQEIGNNSPRLQSMKNRFSDKQANLNTIKEALCSADNPREPVCNSQTWISTIMEFHHNYTVFWISSGKPNEVGYQRIQIPGKGNIK